MLTIKEKLLETMKKDGHPDRFVKGFEFVNLIPETSYYMGDYPIIPSNQEKLLQRTARSNSSARCIRRSGRV